MVARSTTPGLRSMMLVACLRSTDVCLLTLIKYQFNAPTCRVNVWNNHVFTLSTNLDPRF
jgi:hypothetical protein